MPYWNTGQSVVSLALISFPHKVRSIVFSTMVHIIITASSGVADTLRTGPQYIPSKLTGKIGEQATPSNLKNARCYPWSPYWCRVCIILMVPSANIRRDTIDHLISYKWINKGSKQKMYTIWRVSVNTHKTMNFTIYNNITNNRYNINYNVKSHRMLKTKIQVWGTTPMYNPTILINVSTLSNFTLNGIKPYWHWYPVPKNSAGFFPYLRFSTSFMSDSFIPGGKWHRLWYLVGYFSNYC